VNRAELQEWQYHLADHVLGEGVVQVERGGVRFARFVTAASIQFQYGNASGLIFADNTVNWQEADDSPKRYEPAAKLSCRYSNECKYNPHCIPPNLDAIAAAIKQSWERFSTGR